MTFKRLKLEVFFLKKAFFQYHAGWRYIYSKFFLVNTILKSGIIETPISNHDLSMHILTSHKDMKMMLWSLASFYKVFKNPGQLYIHSDGSVTSQDREMLKKFLPTASVVDSNNFARDFGNQLDQHQTIKKFRTEYQQYFLLKKLIDPYLVSDKQYHLIIDTDLLWYKTPAEIETAINQGCIKSLMMPSPIPTYVYFKDGRLAENLAMKNSGIVLYAKKNFNLNKLAEYLTKIDTANLENNHFIEQAGYAYCLDSLEDLPKDTYIIKESVTANTIMRHYTSPRRPLFYIEGLEKFKSGSN